MVQAPKWMNLKSTKTKNSDKRPYTVHFHLHKMSWTGFSIEIENILVGDWQYLKEDLGEVVSDC